MRLQDKVALITGAGSNIGRAMARLFAREGAAVVVGDTDETGGGETVRLIEAAGGRACSVAGDVSTTQGLRQSIDGAVETYGRLDMFLSNANSGASGTIAQFDRAGAEKLLMVNLMALMEGAHYCLPHMQQAGGGAIVATSSVQALVGVPGHPAYGAAKAGILGAVRSMAVELWPYKVRVNAVCPGGTGGKTWTVIDELGEEYLPEFEERFGREMRHLPLPVPTDPMAIAQAALFLASDEASYITGQHLSVDAGLGMLRYSVFHGPEPLDTPQARSQRHSELQAEFEAWLAAKKEEQVREP